ncbi:metallophosphoesterase family protein [Micromonospora sp. C31]|uniref:metallophosphoesterase family protein n=1 Tax=Micromonospora sp. C31 TaxID=2824876 RepID=UPI0027DD2F13|nr:metallophosphoesterase family protein [Micromonospora sp. C31]
MLADVPAEVATVVCGHTHMPFTRLADRRLIVNPGSVGMPYGGPGAYWALLGPGAHLRRTPFDVDAACARVSGLRMPRPRPRCLRHRCRAVPGGCRAVPGGCRACRPGAPGFRCGRSTRGSIVRCRRSPPGPRSGWGSPVVPCRAAPSIGPADLSGRACAFPTGPCPICGGSSTAPIRSGRREPTPDEPTPDEPAPTGRHPTSRHPTSRRRGRRPARLPHP